MKMEATHELIEHQTITAIVDNVDEAHKEVTAAFGLLSTAKKRLAAALGDDHNSSNQIIPHRNYYGDSIFEKPEDCHKMITKNAWRYILNQTGLNHYMTAKRQKELSEQIDNDQLPPLTVENIVGTLQGLAGKIDGLLMESVKEVFNWLRPQNAWDNGKLKTNHKFFVGEKAIVYGVERNYRGGFMVRYRYEGNFRALGNVFSILDGKGVVKYPDDFYTRFNEAMSKAGAGDKFEDEYFECKCYSNGNLHIKFKRADLLAKLNQMGSDGSLTE